MIKQKIENTDWPSITETMHQYGYYRINIKHGVNEVKSGERYTLGIIFHDAIS